MTIYILYQVTSRMAGVHQKLLVLAGVVAGALSGNSSIFDLFQNKILQTKIGVMYQINGSCHGWNPRFINNKYQTLTLHDVNHIKGRCQDK